MNCLNMENPENPQEWYGVNEHRFCTVLEVKDGKIIWMSRGIAHIERVKKHARVFVMCLYSVHWNILCPCAFSSYFST